VESTPAAARVIAHTTQRARSPAQRVTIREMSRLLSSALLPALVVAALASCATPTPASRPIVDFPAPAALAAIEARPPVAPPVPPAGPATGAIEVHGPLPARAGSAPTAAEGAAAAAFVEAAARAGRRAPLTAALTCVARELGRFYLARGAWPGDGVRQFLGGACGALAPQAGYAYTHAQIPADVPEARVVEVWKDGLRAGLLDRLPTDATGTGFWFGRQGDRVVAVASYEVLRAEIAPFPLTPDDKGEVVIEGRVTGAVEHLGAYVNHGRFGVAPCDLDPAVPRPRFRAICRPDPGDRAAWVQLVQTQPRRVLALPFAQALIRRSEGDRPSYAESAYAAARPVSSAEGFTRAVLEALNANRAEAGLPAVRLAAVQSATAARLAPHYFAAALGAAPTGETDTIALGLLAGWQVPGMIRDAGFLSSFVAHTHDAGRWLGAALELPLGRQALLAPEIEEIAIGAQIARAPDALGAVVVGYQFHHENDHGRDVARLYQRILAARRHRGLPPIKRLSTMDRVLADALARVHAGLDQPRDALEVALQAGVVRFGNGMRGWVLETTSLDAVEIPAEVLEKPTLHLEVGVTHHKPRGAAWAQLVIVVVFVDYHEPPA
jgi:hypothetical protein